MAAFLAWLQTCCFRNTKDKGWEGREGHQQEQMMAVTGLWEMLRVTKVTESCTTPLETNVLNVLSKENHLLKRRKQSAVVGLRASCGKTQEGI